MWKSNISIKTKTYKTTIIYILCTTYIMPVDRTEKRDIEEEETQVICERKVAGAAEQQQH